MNICPSGKTYLTAINHLNLDHVSVYELQKIYTTEEKQRE